jgi:hypothetical protein
MVHPGWITFIKRPTSEKEIHFSFRGTVILFILLSISGDTIKKIKMSFFDLFWSFTWKQMALPFNLDPNNIKETKLSNTSFFIYINTFFIK